MSLLTGLKALYHLNENANDSSGNGNNGTIFGATSDTVNQKLGSGCYDFDAVDDYIDCGSDSSIDDLTVKSVSAWIKPSGWGHLGVGRVITKAAGALDGFGILIQLAGVGIERLTFIQDFSGGVAQWETLDNSISLNVWQHIVLIYDSSSTANDPIMYINGASQTINETASPSGTVESDASNNLWIGARNDSGTPSREFDGLIDELALWDRGLTSDEVSQLYNGGDGIEVGGVGSLINGGLINSGLIGGRLCT